MRRAWVFLFVILSPKIFNPAVYNNKLVVWDVGQGQWVSWITNTHCSHFDFGGEHFPEHVAKACSGKQNRLALTHWDYDHLNFTQRVLRLFPKLCLYSLPLGHHKIRSKLETLRPCLSKDFPKGLEVFLATPNLKGNLKKNDQGSIFIIRGQILITGDLSGTEEDKRIQSDMVRSIKVALAGHHGSMTSSSESLLRKLKELDLVMVSARYKRYGHPHPKVLARYSAKKTPVLKTQDWGHISKEF